MRLGFSLFGLFTDAVLDSRLGGAIATNSSDGTTWSIPCKSSLSLTVVFSGKSYTVPADKLVEGDTSGTMCTGLVRSWDNPFITSYLLGRTFAQTVYMYASFHVWDVYSQPTAFTMRIAMAQIPLGLLHVDLVPCGIRG